MTLWNICVDFPDFERWIYDVPSDNPPTEYLGFTVLDFYEADDDDGEPYEETQ